MQSNPVVSGSGISSPAQMMPPISTTAPMSYGMTTPLKRPQGLLPRIGETQKDDQVPMGPQGNQRVSFGLVFDASSGQDENNYTGGGNTSNDGIL